jgi:glycosyltransferase involved in cell wall biosynthesis
MTAVNSRAPRPDERVVAGAAVVVPAADRVPVTVVIPTLNEAHQLPRALDSLTWADEVIVIDGGSTDGTVSIAEHGGARVVTLIGHTIAAQRNAGIEVARNRWILALDADEEASAELRDSLIGLARELDPAHTAYRVRSRNWYLGTELHHGPWGRDWKVRVFARERRYRDLRVHEHLESLGKVGTLDGTLLHHPYRDLHHHVLKIAKYARWGAEDLHARGRRAHVSDLVARPVWRFIRDYLIYGGWRDGGLGFVAAALGAFAAFLKYASLLTLGRSKA